MKAPADRPWYLWVDPKRRRNLLEILNELSRLQNEQYPAFILVGALALLIRGYLKYMVYWDVDLLFKDKKSLLDFANRPKSSHLKIVAYDDELQEKKHISSLHTFWSFDKTWFNVDYILMDNLFDFYYATLSKEGPYFAEIKVNGRLYDLNLMVAHPWDVFVQKLTTPRFRVALELKDGLSFDICHILTLFRQDGDNPRFWQWVAEKAAILKGKERVKRNLIELLSTVREFGHSVTVSERMLETIKKL